MLFWNIIPYGIIRSFIPHDISYINSNKPRFIINNNCSYPPKFGIFENFNY